MMTAVGDPAADPIDDGTLAGLPEVLLAALEQSRSATCITAAELDPPGPEIVYVNPAYCSMTGYQRGEVIGRSPRLMQGPLTDRAELDRLRSDLTAGRSFSGQTVNYRADGSPFVISWSIDPVRDPAGRITHFVATQEDVTEKVRAANLLAATEQLDEVLIDILRSSVDADAGLERVAAEVARGASQIAALGTASVSLYDDQRRVAVSAGPPVGDNAVALRFDLPESALRGLVRVGELSDQDEGFVDRTGLAAYVRRVGTVVAALVEYHRQRAIALRLQRELLPPEGLTAPCCLVAARYAPGLVGSRVGGDWYDVAVSENRLVFTVGDVSGNGVEAAALMGRLRVLAAAELERGASIGEMLARLDRMCVPARQLATMLAAELDRGSGELRLWSAGHLPPVLLSPTGGRLLDVIPGPPLGYADRAPLAPTSVVLEPGAGLLLFTDGLVERRGEVLDRGLARTVAECQSVRTLDELLDRLLASLPDGHDDDVAMLAFQRRC